MRILFCTTFISLALLSAAQQSRSPIIYSVPGKSAPSLKEHSGFVVLNTNDTLTGNIQLGIRKKGKDGITLASGRFIPLQEINMIRLFAADKSVVSTDHTDYRVLGEKSRLLRLLVSGKVEVYDESLYCNEWKGEMGAEIFVAESNKLHSLFNFWNRDTKADLLKFINNRYNASFKRKDFKSNTDMIRYIADKG